MQRYGVALLAVAGAAAFRLLLEPLLGTQFPFIQFFPAVMVAAWYGGLGPGLLATALSAFGSTFLLAPIGSLQVAHAPDLVALTLFVATGSVISALNESLHRSRQGVEEARRRSEEAAASMRESEERFRLMADTAPVMIWVSGPDKRCTYFNRSWLEFTGRTLEQEHGDGWIEGVHPDDLENCLATYTRAFDARQPFRMEYRLRRHDGEYRWVLDEGIPRLGSGGEFSGYIGACLDLTERRQVEEASARLAAIVESSEDAIIGKDLEGRITSWNRGAERLYGYRAEEVIGRPISLLVPPEYPDDVQGILERLKRGERVEQYETLRMTRDGRRLHISLAISPIRDAEGRITGASAIARDVTERREMEAALQQRAEQIRTQNEELEAQNEELQMLNQELAEQDRHRNEFLAMLAHELRNPLAPIVSAVEVLRLRGPEDAALQRHRATIERQARHLARLLDDLLDVSRITQGKIMLRKEPVELSSVIEQALQICGPLVSERQHELSVTLPPEALFVEADATRLVQVVCNLLNNAAKYTEPGGRIDLAVEGERGEGAGERPSLSPAPSPLSPAVIRVRDTGRGIPPQVLPYIFDLFVQAERTADRAEGGLGIGLTLVRSLVEQHGGTVEVRSEGPGHGSEFIVRLPILKAEGGRIKDEGREPVPLHPSSFRLLPSRKVLVIDDNADAAETLSELISLWGYEVRTAHSGQQGLEELSTFAPDVVLLDIGMPGMDGYEVARQFRQSPARESMCLVALTGYSQEADRRRAREAGFDHHLIKPVEPRALQALLTSLTGDMGGNGETGK